jgi:protein-S-isoprenylcysteine O-methyltransferase Ste14
MNKIHAGERRSLSKAMSIILETAILLLLPIFLHLLIPILYLISAPFSYTGVALMVGGFGLMSWGSRTFRQRGIGFTLKEERSTVVVEGPFRFTRNPMYLGMLIWLLGLATVLGSLGAFLIPIFFFILANFFIVPIEENEMERTFGEEYLAYKRKVRRWL